MPILTIDWHTKHLHVFGTNTKVGTDTHFHYFLFQLHGLNVFDRAVMSLRLETLGCIGSIELNNFGAE
jgi:hypothetical protein